MSALSAKADTPPGEQHSMKAGGKVDFELKFCPHGDCQVPHAVQDRTGLHLPAPQNGNFLSTGQRLSANVLNFCSIFGASETILNLRNAAYVRAFPPLLGLDKERPDLGAGAA